MTKRRPIVNLLIWFSILTSSFDILFAFEFNGITIRGSQIVMLFVMLIFLFEFVIGKAKVTIPVALPWLVLCVFLNTVFCFRSLSLENALAYNMWFAFDTLQILVIVYYFRQSETVKSITKKYLYCFVIMAIVGLIQVVLQYKGINFYVTQENEMHRANGFSYEPSYYATYMLIGWCMCMYLFEKSNFSVVSRWKLTLFTILITLALILSTSRMGWIMMAGYIGVRLLFNLGTLFVGRITRWKVLLIAAIVLVLLVIVYLIYGLSTQNETVLTYTDGLGIGDASGHSSSDRIERMMYTLQVFMANPIVGVSLGGVDPAICYGILGQDTLINGTAMTVFAELLAGLGIFGFAFFMIYLYNLLFRYRRIKYANKSQKQVTIAYIAALVFVLIILQMNQNILRPILWVHIALLSSVYSISIKNAKLLNNEKALDAGRI